jgi:hypothetical protein
VPPLVYSVRLGEATLNAPGSTAVFVVPVSSVVIVRSITSTCTGGSSSQGLWYRTGGGIYRYVESPLDTTLLDNDLRWVFNAGEGLTFQNVSGDWQVSCHGYLLPA